MKCFLHFRNSLVYLAFILASLLIPFTTANALSDGEGEWVLVKTQYTIVYEAPKNSSKVLPVDLLKGELVKVVQKRMLLRKEELHTGLSWK